MLSGAGEDDGEEEEGGEERVRQKKKEEDISRGTWWRPRVSLSNGLSERGQQEQSFL